MTAMMSAIFPRGIHWAGHGDLADVTNSASLLVRVLA